MAGERVLIVDDEPSIQTLVGRVCRQQGYEVALASDGAGAFRLLQEAPYDVGIVDLGLPDADGLDVLRRIKELYPDCEVIILTGIGGFESAVEALRLGAYDYLQKPLDDLEIIPLTIRRALDKRELARHNQRLVKELQAVNYELERRRRQQLEHIQHIGQALTGAMQARDMAGVLVQSILNAVDCDGAAVLLLPKNSSPGHLMIAGAPRALSPKASQALLGALLERLPESVRPDVSEIEINTLPAASTEASISAETDDEWQQLSLRSLSGRDNPSGVVVLASHSDTPFSKDILDIFGILVSQGSIALENAYLFARMKGLATKDSLTGLYNHGHFFDLLEAEISRAERHGMELGVIMLDIDRAHGLKTVNDTYGHPAGDSVLCQVARLLEQSVRRADSVARYGGDEFIVLVPQSGMQHTLSLAERLCRVVREMPFDALGHEVKIAVSVGAAILHPGCNQSASSVVSEADRAMYLAKGRGGDQVAILPAEGACANAPMNGPNSS